MRIHSVIAAAIAAIAGLGAIAAIAGLGAIAAIAGLGACQTERRPSLEARLLAEFEDAYPADAPPSRGVVAHALRAAPAQVQLFEGRTLEVWAYDGQVPGPTYRVRLGQTLRVDFRNDLPQPTTIHFHGVRVPNAMDGVPNVTQPPIPPGGSFVYEFTPKDAGTFWFHPHVRGAEQVERGLFGVLVVEDDPALPYSRDLVWVIDDWRLGADGQIDGNFVTRADLAHDGRWGRTITVNGSTRHELLVQPGERIRLRLVNTANGRVFKPDFSDFDAVIIAVDGRYTREPLPSSGFEMAPGNRLDLDITIRPDQRGALYHVVDTFTRQVNPLAAIRVGDRPVATPSFPSPARAHVPAWDDAPSAPVFAKFALGARRGGPYGIEWTINDKAHGHGEDDITPLPLGRWIKLRFENTSARLHPMHVHGQFFKVVARDGVAAPEPHFRDTVLVHPRETVDVGMVPLDPGKWMLHCHILEHAEAGMMTLVEVKPPR